MKTPKGKRGQAEAQQILTVIEVLMGLAVVIFLILAATSYNSFTGFNRAFLKEDLKMVINAISSSNGDIEMEYDINADYEVVMKEDDIDVVEKPTTALKGKQVLVMGYSSSTKEWTSERVAGEEG